MISNGLFLSITWAVNTIISLTTIYFPEGNEIAISQLTPENLTRVGYITDLLLSMVGYIQPLLSQLDQETLTRLYLELGRVIFHVTFYLFRCNTSSLNGQLPTEVNETFAGYNGPLYAAMVALRGLADSISTMLTPT